MRYIYLAAILLLALTSCKENKSNNNDIPFPCEGGLSDNQYVCENIDLFAVVTPQELQGLDKNSTPTVNLNDIWGWTDSQTGKEYALVGLTNGVSFVDVSDPSAPVVIGKLNESNISAKYKTLTDPNYEACKVGIGDTEKSKSLTEGSVWRDHKVFDDHLFIGSDAQSHGVQVFDLTKLR
ncbi:MAG: hypothetical protein ABJF72_13130, partial [Balneola sp.]